jgi:hypothetical protein
MEVMLIWEWPSICMTTRWSTPWASKRVAAVCRASCTRASRAAVGSMCRCPMTAPGYDELQLKLQLASRQDHRIKTDQQVRWRWGAWGSNPEPTD